MILYNWELNEWMNTNIIFPGSQKNLEYFFPKKTKTSNLDNPFFHLSVFLAKELRHNLYYFN